MTPATAYPHITIDAQGVARIADTRYKLRHLAAEHYQYGWTAEELLRQHPDLRPEQVYSALTYFYDHHDDMVRELKASEQAIEVARPPQTVSRDELLNRLDASGV